MRALCFFVSLFLAFISTSTAASLFKAKQYAELTTVSNNQDLQKTCRHIRALNHLMSLANNQTQLDQLLADGLYTPSQIAYIKSRTEASASELATLNSNTTLTSECDTINAQRAVRKQCRKLSRLEKLTELANNQTAYDAYLGADTFNKKQVEDLQKNMEDAEIKLQRLRENATLIEVCASEPELGNGAIGMAAVDHSGAISLTSDAMALLLPYSRWICLPILVGLGIAL